MEAIIKKNGKVVSGRLADILVKRGVAKKKPGRKAKAQISETDNKDEKEKAEKVVKKQPRKPIAKKTVKPNK